MRYEEIEQILKNIQKQGETILHDNVISYDGRNRRNFTQPYYNLIAGMSKVFNITNVVEVGTHCGGSGLSFLKGNPELQLITIDTVEHKLAVGRLGENKNCIRIIGDSLSKKVLEEVKLNFSKLGGKTLLYIDALKDGPWIEKNIQEYSFINTDYILLDDITTDITIEWWHEFSNGKRGYFNIEDYLGWESRNTDSLRQAHGFGLIVTELENDED